MFFEIYVYRKFHFLHIGLNMKPVKKWVFLLILTAITFVTVITIMIKTKLVPKDKKLSERTSTGFLITSYNSVSVWKNISKYEYYYTMDDQSLKKNSSTKKSQSNVRKLIFIAYTDIRNIRTANRSPQYSIYFQLEKQI